MRIVFSQLQPFLDSRLSCARVPGGLLVQHAAKLGAEALFLVQNEEGIKEVEAYMESQRNAAGIGFSRAEIEMITAEIARRLFIQKLSALKPLLQG